MGNVPRRRCKSAETEGDYKVGYGRPPKHTRFKPGQSGNPKGRPKDVRNFTTDLLKTLGTKVRVTSEGRAQKVSTQLAALLRLREMALGGDARVLDKLLTLAGAYNNEDRPVTGSLSFDDAELLELFTSRLSRKAVTAPMPDNTSPNSNDRNDIAGASEDEKPAPARKRKRLRRLRP